MGLYGMSIDINTVPVVAVGIGVGIDYSIYMMDRIREFMAKNGQPFLTQFANQSPPLEWPLVSQPLP